MRGASSAEFPLTIDRVFLDANILFSAAWRANVSPAVVLWTLPDTVLISSAFAIAEADRNLDLPAARTRLYRLVQDLEIVDEPSPSATLPIGIQLPAKDQPILLAAIQARCTHLLTGDRKHFGQYFQQSIGGVRVVTVRDYLTARGGI